LKHDTIYKSNKMEITGKIKVIGDVQTFPSGFTKRVLVITTEETYPQHVPIEFLKDKCGLLDTLTVDQDITVAVNVRGQEYNGNYYVSLNAWKIVSVAPSF